MKQDRLHPKPSELTLRQEMELNASAYNSMLTPEVLAKKNLWELLRNCHPNRRPEFAQRVYNSKLTLMTESDLREFTQII